MHILIDQQEAVEDPRTGNAKRHKLGDILFIAIAAGVAEADTWHEIRMTLRITKIASMVNCKLDLNTIPLI